MGDTQHIMASKVLTQDIIGNSQLRVHNYNTSEKVASFEAHPDYIRAICVHPTQPFVLTASDDMTIKLWNWEMGWKCQQTFEGHSHYVCRSRRCPGRT